MRCGRSALEDALDGDGRQLTDLLPALERLIGAQPEPEALGAAEAENRLFSLLAAFVRELAADRPFVLFLDDLQWADATTLELLQRLAADERLERLMLVAAYRSDAADTGLDDVLRAVRSAGDRSHQLGAPRRSITTRSRRCWSRRCERPRKMPHRSRA